MPNSEKDMLVLAQVPGTSIYEGYLGNELDVPVVLIDVPSTNKRVVSVSLPLKYLQYVTKGFQTCRDLVKIAFTLYQIGQLQYRQNPKLQFF